LIAGSSAVHRRVTDSWPAVPVRPVGAAGGGSAAVEGA
jgi:hypothetical protein